MRSSIPTHRPHGLPRALVVLTVLIVLITSAVSPATGAGQDADEETPLDLAAMALRPSDLEAEEIEGFGDAWMIRHAQPWSYLPSGFMVLPEAAEHSPVATAPDPIVGTIFQRLAAAGWQRQFRGVLGKAGDPISVVVVSTIGEYADEDGAEAAFALLTATDDVPGVDDFDDVAGFGDATAAHRDRTSLLSLNGDRFTLTFRVANLVAAVQVTGDDDEVSEIDTLEVLAELLVERIEAVRDGEDGGLSHLALHLDIDAEHGDELWRFDGIHEEQFFSGGPTVAGGPIFVGASDGGLYALDAASGDEAWRFAPEIDLWEGIEDGGMLFNDPAVVDGVVYVGTGSEFDEVEGDGFLFALDAEDGEELWRYETGDPLREQPAFSGEVVYAADDAEEGEAAWTFELDGAAAGAPAVVDGVIYLTTDDGSVYAIAGDERRRD
jgi:hypothetical protein